MNQIGRLTDETSITTIACSAILFGARCAIAILDDGIGLRTGADTAISITVVATEARLALGGGVARQTASWTLRTPTINNIVSFGTTCDTSITIKIACAAACAICRRE